MKPFRPNLVVAGANRRAGFSMVEMLTVVALLSLVMLVLTESFNITRKAVGMGASHAETLNYVRAVESQLRQDAATVQRDAFLVIRSSNRMFNGRPYAADQLLLFSHSKQSSARLIDGATAGQRYYAPLARVWWGHLAADRNGAEPEGDPREFILGRQPLLIAPPGFGERFASSVDSFWLAGAGFAPEPRVVAGLVDVAHTSSSDIRKQVMAAGSATNQRDRMARACYRIFGTTPDRLPAVAGASAEAQATAIGDMLMATHAIIAPNCSYFRVEFAGDYWGNDGRIDTDSGGAPGGGENQPIFWYGGGDLTAGQSGVRLTGVAEIDLPADSANATYVFGYDRGRTRWPRMLRVTIGLHDLSGRVNQGPSSPPSRPDGRMYRFILLLDG